MGYAINKIEAAEWVKIVMVLSLPALSILPIPFRIGTALYYIPFFYAGIMFFRNKRFIIDRFSKTPKSSILCGVVFASAFILGTLFVRDVLPQYQTMSENLIVKGAIIEISTYVKLAYSALGVLFTYVFVNYLLNKTERNVPNWIMHFNKMCQEKRLIFSSITPQPSRILPSLFFQFASS